MAMTMQMRVPSARRQGVPPGIMPAHARIPTSNPYGFNPQPEPPRGRSLNIYGFNPQPEPPLGALDDSEKKGFWRGALVGVVLGGLTAFVIGTGIKRSW